MPSFSYVLIMGSGFNVKIVGINVIFVAIKFNLYEFLEKFSLKENITEISLKCETVIDERHSATELGTNL